MIEELYTKKNIDLRNRAREVAETAMRPGAAIHDVEQTYPWEVQKAIQAAGLSGVWIPEDYGGAGGGDLELASGWLDASRGSGPPSG